MTSDAQLTGGTVFVRLVTQSLLCPAAQASRHASSAEVAELADAHGSGPCTRKGVGVRVPSSAPKAFPINKMSTQLERILAHTRLEVRDRRAAADLPLLERKAAAHSPRGFDSFRVLGDDMLRNAGDAAEGLEIVFPFDPTRDDPPWLAFNSRFEKRFGSRPDVFASLAYDTMNILLQAVCRAGLNRGKIRDALTAVEDCKGVTGDMVFDPNCKNMVPMYLATVHGGKYQFRRYPMQVPYARVGEGGVQYNSPPIAD